MVFSFNVPASTFIRLEERPPLNGVLWKVKRAIPAGPNNYVDFCYGIDRKRYPQEGFFNFNNVFDETEYNYPVTTRNTLWVEFFNRDGVNPHFLTVVMVIRETPPIAGKESSQLTRSEA